MSGDNDSSLKVCDNSNNTKLQKRIAETMEWALSKALNSMRATLQEATTIATAGGSGGKW